MNENNWSDGRVKGVVAVSGQKNFFDMNAISSLPIHKNYFDINLDGAGGDGIFAGGHLKYANTTDLKQAIKEGYFKHGLNKGDSALVELLDYYNKIGSDQYFIYIKELEDLLFLVLF